MFGSPVTIVLCGINLSILAMIVILWLSLLAEAFITAREPDKDGLSLLASSECGWLVSMLTFGAGLVLTYLFPKIGNAVLVPLQVVGFGLGLIAARAAYPVISAWDDDDGRGAGAGQNGEIGDCDPIPEPFADSLAGSDGEGRKSTLVDHADALSAAAMNVAPGKRSGSKRKFEKEKRYER